MKTIKKILLLTLFSVSALAFYNCDGEKENTFLSFQERIQKLNNLTFKVDDLMGKLANKKGNLAFLKTQENELEPIAEDFKSILKDIGFEDTDLKEITGGEINNDVYAIFGVMLAFKHSESSNSDKIYFNISNNRGGSLAYCAAEAFGVNAAVALVNSLHALYAGEVAAGFAVDAAAATAFRSAALKAAGKIISRFAGGLGAIIMLAEFASCMW